ncbi:MAG: hypothetical protein INQ03_25595 [Candidatus Heimdallarchaeota archaeon]|nr:hypothetical protein [Candidatus Heimdallarchaeota archaeon]
MMFRFFIKTKIPKPWLISIVFIVILISTHLFTLNIASIEFNLLQNIESDTEIPDYYIYGMQEGQVDIEDELALIIENMTTRIEIFGYFTNISSPIRTIVIHTTEEQFIEPGFYSFVSFINLNKSSSFPELSNLEPVFLNLPMELIFLSSYLSASYFADIDIILVNSLDFSTLNLDQSLKIFGYTIDDSLQFLSIDDELQRIRKNRDSMNDVLYKFGNLEFSIFQVIEQKLEKSFDELENQKQILLTVLFMFIVLFLISLDILYAKWISELNEYRVLVGYRGAKEDFSLKIILMISSFIIGFCIFLYLPFLLLHHQFLDGVSTYYSDIFLLEYIIILPVGLAFNFFIIFMKIKNITFGSFNILPVTAFIFGLLLFNSDGQRSTALLLLLFSSIYALGFILKLYSISGKAKTTKDSFKIKIHSFLNYRVRRQYLLHLRGTMILLIILFALSQNIYYQTMQNDVAIGAEITISYDPEFDYSKLIIIEGIAMSNISYSMLHIDTIGSSLKSLDLFIVDSNSLQKVTAFHPELTNADEFLNEMSSETLYLYDFPNNDKIDLDASRISLKAGNDFIELNDIDWLDVLIPGILEYSINMQDIGIISLSYYLQLTGEDKIPVPRYTVINTDNKESLNQVLAIINENSLKYSKTSEISSVFQVPFSFLFLLILLCLVSVLLLNLYVIYSLLNLERELFPNQSFNRFKNNFNLRKSYLIRSEIVNIFILSIYFIFKLIFWYFIYDFNISFIIEPLEFLVLFSLSFIPNITSYFMNKQ